MIPKADVKVIGIGSNSNKTHFVVAGYSGTIGYYPSWQKRSYKSYDQALKYSLKLRDYYQVDVKEFNL
jgi:hypothetical protein